MGGEGATQDNRLRFNKIATPHFDGFWRKFKIFCRHLNLDPLPLNRKSADQHCGGASKYNFPLFSKCNLPQILTMYLDTIYECFGSMIWNSKLGTKLNILIKQQTMNQALWLDTLQLKPSQVVIQNNNRLLEPKKIIEKSFNTGCLLDSLQSHSTELHMCVLKALSLSSSISSRWEENGGCN